MPAELLENYCLLVRIEAPQVKPQHKWLSVRHGELFGVIHQKQVSARALLYLPASPGRLGLSQESIAEVASGERQDVDRHEATSLKTLRAEIVRERGCLQRQSARCAQ